MLWVTPTLLLHRNSTLFFSFPSSPIPTRPPAPFFLRCSSQVHASSSNDAEQLRLDELHAPFPPLKAAKRVILVRHGQSTWNEEGRIQGSSNFSVLTNKGEAQAQTSCQMLIHDAFDVCFASPLARAKRTAEIIWDTRKEDVILDFDLREIDLYSFQGLLKHEGKEKFGAAFQKWQVDAPNFSIDDHYPVRELWERARSCWTRILLHESRSVLVVAHNAVNQALLATAIGLGTEYFRTLVQSNCGVSVLDFIPRAEGGSPYICLNRLNQCRPQVHLLKLEVQEEGKLPMDMLAVIKAQKIAELLLDLKVNSIVSSPKGACVETAVAISRVQEAADCLGADSVPRYVEMKQMENLDVENILQKSNKNDMDIPLQPGWLKGFEDRVLEAVWDQSEKAWQSLLEEVADEVAPEKVVIAVGHPALHIALLSHCLNLTKEWLGSFHLDAGSISIIDFPDGPTARGVIRCINYTAHLGRWSIPITRSTER